MRFDDPAAVSAAVRAGFGAPRLLVVGDPMLDRYLWGEVGRISPEAPVPVLHLHRETEVPGGAANVARNLASLGVQVTLAGVIGDDQAGETLRRLLERRGIAPVLLTVAERITTVKTRVIGNHQQMLRIDAEVTHPVRPAEQDRLFAAVAPVLEQSDGLLLSDYAKGVLNNPLCQRLIAAARARQIPVLVDPKGRDFQRYRGATVITPNRLELALATDTPAAALDAVLAAGSRLRAALELEAVVVTLGERGLTLIEATRTQHLPAVARDVFDVSGAGDTVIAVLAAALSARLALSDAARLANLAAGITVGKVGTAPIERAELLAALTEPATPANKLLALDELLALTERWRARGERIVFTNGCFDLLHAGHVHYLEQARRLGERLIVGLNTDRSVRALKGPQRPLNCAMDRARVLAALAAVDAVVLFDDDTPLRLIAALRPEVLVKGADYRLEQVVGAAEVQSWGGRVELIPLLPGHSSSALIAALRDRAPE